MNDHQIDWTSIENARLMGLDYAPKTSTAVAFCDALADTLGALEAHRKNQRRGGRKKAFNKTAGAAAADLLKAAQHEPRRWSWRQLGAQHFTDAPVTYTDFRCVVTAAEAGDLIERHRGHYQRFELIGGVVGIGKATRFRAKPKLITLAADHGITPENIDEHFEQELPKVPPKPLVLKASSTRVRRVKFKGQSISFQRTALTERLEREVSELNEFLARHEIAGGIHRGYRRIFNQGDIHSYRWNKGGRLYSIGDDSYQALKKEQRLEMMLDHEPVAEIDIRASYLTLLHGLKKVPFNAAEQDPYEVKGVPRSVVKAWVTMTFGHTNWHKRWPAQVVEELRDNGDRLDPKDYPVTQIAPLILDALPILKDWPAQTITGFDLMYLESEAVIGTMLELMHEHDCPSLSVHDSLIVPIRMMDKARAILERRYREVAGTAPYLRIELAPNPRLAAWF
jgi:hypothetical protein